MIEIPCPEPKCGHDIDYHFEGGCEFLHEVNEYCACDFAPSDIAHALLTAEPTEAEVRAASEALHADNCPEDDEHRGCTCGDWDREALIALRAATEARR
ncbi:Uncharacterised protein [Mycobacteroides abscessus subsp. abscessus]|nr:Uncharacterised protein [Mycobacteroides abscessus subsp. abscessus]